MTTNDSRTFTLAEALAGIDAKAFGRGSITWVTDTETRIVVSNDGKDPWIDIGALRRKHNGHWSGELPVLYWRWIRLEPVTDAPMKGSMHIIPSGVTK